jgi:hypothetical protein
MGIEMPRTAAKVTQADIARVLRAIKQSGLSMTVEISRDGNITLEPVDGEKPARFDKRTPVRL